jgi:hypothetical protein
MLSRYDPAFHEAYAPIAAIRSRSARRFVLRQLCADHGYRSAAVAVLPQMRNLAIIVLVLVSFLSFEPSALASHPNYGGDHHGGSHGGHYPGGKGSSHKGGKYKNPKTDNQYGRHKK